MAQPMLTIENLTVTFGGLTAINDFSMEIAPQRIHALIGPNGAGKSTVFNCISRFYDPAAGRILVEGNDLTTASPHTVPRFGVARTFQNLELFGPLSVFENVQLGMHSRVKSHQRRHKSEIRDEIENILEQTGLAEYRNTEADTLDFGHQKMLELARALAARPKLLLLDEPAAGLRNNEIAALDELLTTLVDSRGLTVLLVEHVMQLVMSVSDHITVLNSGIKIAEGTPTQIRNDPAVIEAYLGSREEGSANA